MAFYLFEHPGKKKAATSSTTARTLASQNPKNTTSAINAFFGP